MKKLKLDEELICKLYLDEFSTREIADMFRCSRNPITRILKNRGILRTPDEALRTKRRCDKIRARKIRYWAFNSWRITGERNHNFGKTASPETREKMSVSAKKRIARDGPPQMSESGKRRLSEQRRGEGNPIWKGGVSRSVGIRVWEDWHMRKFPDDMMLHHMDENPGNNEFWNLLAVTRSEHAKIHGIGKNFGKGG